MEGWDLVESWEDRSLDMMVPVVDLAYSDGELNMGKSRLGQTTFD